jgi:hypothetical protein
MKESYLVSKVAIFIKCEDIVAIFIKCEDIVAILKKGCDL